MPRTLKVFGWQSFRVTANLKSNHHGQTYEVVAAFSKAEVGRIVGADPRSLFNLGETGNVEDIKTAMSDPGVVFWKPDNPHGEPFRRANGGSR